MMIAYVVLVWVMSAPFSAAFSTLPSTSFVKFYKEKVQVNDGRTFPRYFGIP